MKVSRKMKKNILVTLAVTVFLLIACSSLLQSSTKADISATNTVNEKEWQVKAPQLFSNVGDYSKLVKSPPNSGQESGNTAVKIGKVTNPFGIRDDILDFILNYFPKNESATYSAIRNEQYELLIYKATTDKMAVSISNDGETAIYCLASAIGFIGADKFFDEVEKVRLSTVEGRQIDKEIRRKLGWKILGNRLTIKEEDAICKKGDY